MKSTKGKNQGHARARHNLSRDEQTARRVRKKQEKARKTTSQLPQKRVVANGRLRVIKPEEVKKESCLTERGEKKSQRNRPCRAKPTFRASEKEKIKEGSDHHRLDGKRG